MNALFTAVVVVQVLAALIIIGLVLLQHGKGADMGAAFGSGASGSLFGATGSSNFLSKSTGIAAAVFFAATLALSYMGTKRGAVSTSGVMDNVVTTPAAAAPAAAPSTTLTPAASAIPAPVAASVPAAAKTPAVTAPANAGANRAASGQSGQIPK